LHLMIGRFDQSLDASHQPEARSAGGR
jgi:hypothetical protein